VPVPWSGVLDDGGLVIEQLHGDPVQTLPDA
jgi:hypothetical protein